MYDYPLCVSAELPVHVDLCHSVCCALLLLYLRDTDVEYPWTVRTDLSLVRTHAMSIASGCSRRLIRGVLVMPIAAASTACLVSRSRATAGSISFWPQPATARQLAGNVACVIAAPRRPISLTIGPLLSCVDVGYHFILVGVVGSTALLTPLCRRSLRSRGPRLRVNALRGYHD